MRASKGVVCAALALAAILIAACGSDDDGSNGSQASGAATGSDTVAVANLDDAGDVLVDADGAALYTADQEADGKVRCTDSCLSIWLPLTVSGKATPTASDDVPGTLATVKRPGGEAQVTYEGAPLYRFAEDPEPGQVTGDGVSDSFGGETFSWNVVSLGEPQAGDDPGSESPGGGYGAYGGY